MGNPQNKTTGKDVELREGGGLAKGLYRKVRGGKPADGREKVGICHVIYPLSRQSPLAR
jgi:hypothetical protein